MAAGRDSVTDRTTDIHFGCRACYCYWRQQLARTTAKESMAREDSKKVASTAPEDFDEDIETTGAAEFLFMCISMFMHVYVCIYLCLCVCVCLCLHV